jgi:3-deoxy-D-manno-octulosonic acid kinase
VTLYEYAARHPGARAMQGRGATYAVPLPQAPGRVVVRHNRHGGLFAPLTRDLFLAPTRAPHELEVSLALTQAGVPTPELLAYAVYPPGGVLQRSDVCSREIPRSRDLAEVLMKGSDAERESALLGAARLAAMLARAGARHHDLNAKNVLLTDGKAYVLDVDRVTLGMDPGEALRGNLARLEHSLRKWRDRFGARVSDPDIAGLEPAARRAFESA